MAREGAQLVVCDKRAEAADKLVLALRDEGHSAIGLAADTTIREDVRRVVAATVEAHDRIDVLVNAAADQRYFPFLETSEEDWDKINDTNVKGYYLFGQEVARHMIAQRRGKIINYSSTAALFGSTGHLAYG